MNAGSRDTPTEEKAQKLASGDSHGHSKTVGSVVMHDHGRHSPASAHSPGVSGKLSGLHSDSSRANRAFGTPSFSTAALSGFPLVDHLPFLPSFIFSPFLGPRTAPVLPVLPPSFLAPPPISNLFPSPGADCGGSNSGWSAHSAGSHNTSSLGSSSSEGDVTAKIDGRTVRSSRCSPDLNLQPVRKIWDCTVTDPVSISDTDMPLSLVTRRDTSSRGSSAAESGVCTGDSIARAASTEASRTPSLDGESGCHPVGENTGIQEQTVPASMADQPAHWSSTKATAETLPATDDAKSSANDDIWSSSVPASRSSGIALPPRKRLTRNAEELQSSAADQSSTSASAVATNSPSSATNFRTIWKKFSATSNVSGPSSHRTLGGKNLHDLIDLRTYFQKQAEQARAAAANKAFIPGKGKGHLYRNASKTSPRNSDQNTGSPRITRSQSKPKKTQSPKSSPAEPPAPVRKSARKKSFNSRFEEYDRTVGKNKKSKTVSSDSAVATSDAGKENSRTPGAEVTPNAEKKSQSKNRRRGKQGKGEAGKDGDLLAIMDVDADDSTSQSHHSNDASQPAFEADSKPNCVENSVPAAVTQDASSAGTRPEDVSVDAEPSVVLPPKFRHSKNKAATAAFDSVAPQTGSDRCVAAVSEPSNSEVTARLKSCNTEMLVMATQSETIASEDSECKIKPCLPVSTEYSEQSEMSTSTLFDEPKVSQVHLLGGRKSLLYRSCTTVENLTNVITETKSAVISGQTESCEYTPVDVNKDLSANESSNTGSVVSDNSASQQIVLSEHHDDALSNRISAQSASDEPNEKVQSAADTDTEQQTDKLVNKSSDVISSKSLVAGDTDAAVITVCTTVTSKTSDHPTLSVTEPPAEVLSVAAAVMSDVNCEVPADSLNDCNSESNVPPGESLDTTVQASSLPDEVCLSAESKSASIVDVATASVSSELTVCTKHVPAGSVTTSLSCRTKPADVYTSTAAEFKSLTSDSLKRPSSVDVDAVDDAKRRRLDSNAVDHSSDEVPSDIIHPVDYIPNLKLSVNLMSISSDNSSQISHVKTVPSTGVATEGSSVTVDSQNKSKSEKSKSVRENRRPKLSRSRRTAKRNSKQPVVEESYSDTASLRETPEADDISEECKLQLLEKSNSLLPTLTSHVDHEAQVTATAVTTKYVVANSAGKTYDTTSTVSSLQLNNEPKTLRISLVAVTEPSVSTHRQKDFRLEDTCSTDKLPAGSSAVAVYTTTTASGLDSSKQFLPGCTVPDAELPAASAGNVMSQDSVARETDSSTLLSQCNFRSLSVVLEKIRNHSSPPPLSPVLPKPMSRRRKRGLKFRSVLPTEVLEAQTDKLLPEAEKPALDSVSLASSADDEYRFTEDNLSESLPLQQFSRSERKTSSRKSRNSLPAANKVKMSPSATSDSSSRGAAGSVDSAVSSEPVLSIIPNAVPKPDAHSAPRSWRKRQNLNDKGARSSSPFTQNGSSLTPVVETSIDGLQLKLRITKCASRSAAVSNNDVKISAPPLSSYEFSDNSSKITDVDDSAVDSEPPAATEVAKAPVSKRRQLKVEGVRSRFLTLHKPSASVPSPDHVKCKLVKVGRRQWMSVGGDEAEDESSSTRLSDAETSVGNSPAPPPSSVDDMVQQPTRDRLRFVSENKKQRRRGRPPKVKTDSADTKSTGSSSKRTRRNAKVSESHSVVTPTKPELQSRITPYKVREDIVPWLDCEDGSSDSQPYFVFDNSAWTIAADIDKYRHNVSTPTEFMSNIDFAICNVLSDCSVVFDCNAVRTPSSVFFVPSELERLMEALVLDDFRRQSDVRTSPKAADPESRTTSASIYSSYSYCNSMPVQISSPQNNSKMDLLLSQPSSLPHNCTLPVDASDSSEQDCTFVGYEYPTRCLPDSVELPLLLDRQILDDELSLSSAFLADPHMPVSCVDFVSSLS